MSYAAQPTAFAVASSSPSATMYTSPPVSTATYSSAGWNAIATFAGIVQGVVVQISPYTRLRVSAESIAAGSEVRTKRTQIDGLVWFSYSTSASASAVRSLMHQLTGFNPLYT